MAQVKGTTLVELVKTIRANKSGAYDALLTDKDREIVSQTILASLWYPYETYKNCLNAVVKVEAKGDMEVVRQWGRQYGEIILTSVYKGSIKEGEPKRSLGAYTSYFRSMFDFAEIQHEFLSDHEVIVTIKDFDPDLKAFPHMARGWTERFLELCGVKDVTSEFVSELSEEKPEFSIKYSWST